jgi:hypothetical protein
VRISADGEFCLGDGEIRVLPQMVAVIDRRPILLRREGEFGWATPRKRSLLAECDSVE